MRQRLDDEAKRFKKIREGEKLLYSQKINLNRFYVSTENLMRSARSRKIEGKDLDEELKEYKSNGRVPKDYISCFFEWTHFKVKIESDS